MFLFIILHPPHLIPYNQIILCKYFQRVIGIQWAQNISKMLKTNQFQQVNCLTMIINTENV